MTAVDSALGRGPINDIAIREEICRTILGQADPRSIETLTPTRGTHACELLEEYSERYGVEGLHAVEWCVRTISAMGWFRACGVDKLPWEITRADHERVTHEAPWDRPGMANHCISGHDYASRKPRQMALELDV